MNVARYYAGVMTGTSLDAADAVLCEAGESFKPVAHSAIPVPQKTAAAFRRLDENGALAAAMDAANEITRICADAFLSLPRRGEIVALGCHGQTVLHRPERGWTLQLLNGALLAELTGADVVCDFRSRDIAAGGQGAPLAPLFHRFFFTDRAPCAIVNLGGVANITVLDADGGARGWDICPANMLLDGWHRRHRGGAFDDGGEWAKGGAVAETLLRTLRAHPFLRLPPPKSCGREQFDLRHFESELSHHRPRDAQATLLEWSAETVAAAIDNCGATTAFLCGGGARNNFLSARIAALSSAKVRPSDDAGIAAEQMEAAAFAWLAKQFMDGAAADVAAITGARGARILGAHHRAGDARNSRN
ncbi:MAG: anhydro-N-acetylmuramic acid kinase [Gammaproteobacteria bacterium]